MERNIVEIFYFNQRFAVDLDLFNRYSNYFLHDEHINTKPIYFCTDFDPKLQHPEETIRAFIEYFEAGNISITHRSAFSIQFLSHKFDIPSLSQIAIEYIENEEHEQELLDEIFSHTENLYQEQENYISAKFEHIIDDDRLLLFSISQLYRIVSKYLAKLTSHKYLKKEEKILTFINKIIEQKGNESFTLIPLFEFSKKGRKLLFEQLKNQIKNLKINFIEKNLIDNAIDAESYQERKEKEELEEKQKMNKYYERKFSSLYQNMESKIDEIRREMKEQNQYHNKQNEYLKEIIIDINNFYSNPNYEMFNKLKPASQQMIISNIKNKEEKVNEQFNNICNLVDYLWKVQQKSKHQFDNNQLIYIQTRDNKQRLSSTQAIEKIVIPTATITILNSNSSIYENEFVNIVNKFEDIYVDIQYPSTEYQQIIKNIVNTKKSREFKLKTQIRIIKINKQERPFRFNKCIDSITIDSSNKIIPQRYFEYCTSLKKVLIPESITKIETRAFYSCSKLNTIQLPESVNIIESGAFGECSSLTDIMIPIPITFISDNLFQNCSTLKNIMIPLSVTSIGNYSFNGCTSLAEIIIPKSVATIGNYSFNGCASLTEIIIPKSVTSIGNYSFSGCTSLTKVTIPSAVKNIGEHCFEGCISIELSNNMITIPDNIFKGCTSLTEIIIPESVATIGDNSFNGCTSLTEIIIPKSVTSIGNYSFSGCTSLTKVTIPSAVKNIGEHCFERCVGLKQVMIDLCHTNIEKNTFKNCQPLKEIITESRITEKNKSSSEKPTISPKQTEVLFELEIFESSYFSSQISKFKEIIIEVKYPSESFQSIYQIINKLKKSQQNRIKICIFISGIETTDQQFYNDKNIDIIKLDSNIKSIKSENNKGSFDKCSSLTQITIPSSVTSIESFAFNLCSSLTQITIPESVTSIESYAFNCCSSLTQITIPESVTSIGNGIFSGCSKLEKIEIKPSQNKRIKLLEGTCLIYKSTPTREYDTLIWAKNDIITANIPSSIKNIGNSAFDHCSSLTQITIPSSVTSIESFAFNHCSSLTQITIPESVTSIESYAFDHCSSLTQITIPKSVTSIGNGIFSGCSKLEKIEIKPSQNKRIKLLEGTFLIYKSTPTREYDTLIWAKNDIITANIPSSIKNIGNSAFNYCSSLTQITIPSSVTSIENYAFDHCSSLTQITIPESVTSIGNCAFNFCSSLTQITIPESVTSIGNCAFNYCSSLTQITIPSSVTSIGEYAFANCESITNIEIPPLVTKIQDFTFLNCKLLVQIILPHSVTSIGNDVFSMCSSLKQITILSSVISIGSNVFLGCSSLKNIDLPHSNKAIESIIPPNVHVTYSK